MTGPARRSLPVLQEQTNAGEKPPRGAAPSAAAAPGGDGSITEEREDRAKGGADTRAGGAALGVLSIHFEGGRCRVNCPFCYLGKRTDAAPPGAPGSLDIDLVEAALEALAYREVAVAISEPVEAVLPALRRLSEVTARRGRRLSLTTTLAVLSTLAAEAPEVLAAAGRVSLSIDPFKGQLAAPALRMGGPVDAEEVRAALRLLADKSAAERVLILTLSTAEFAERVFGPGPGAGPGPGPDADAGAPAAGGLLARLLALPEVDRVALNALKPPPPWCSTAFWLRALQRIAPLLREHLDRRLFLDCYVAARILGIGGCPARPDLSPAVGAGETAAPGVGAVPGGVAFRACVYQPSPDFYARSADELTARLADFTPPAVCPFPIR